MSDQLSYRGVIDETFPLRRDIIDSELIDIHVGDQGLDLTGVGDINALANPVYFELKIGWGGSSCKIYNPIDIFNSEILRVGKIAWQENRGVTDVWKEVRRDD